MRDDFLKKLDDIAKKQKHDKGNTMDTRKINDERGLAYGDFDNGARLNKHFKKAIRQFEDKLSPAQQEGLEMIAVKMSRILNGDPNHVDSWQDIAGYATLVSDSILAKDIGVPNGNRAKTKVV